MKNNVTLLRCIAEGRDGHWEAICLDFDIAVQGKSFEDVYHGLTDMIDSYVQKVSRYPEADQRRLLNRKAPLSLRLKFALVSVMVLIFGSKQGRELHGYTAQAVCRA